MLTYRLKNCNFKAKVTSYKLRRKLQVQRAECQRPQGHWENAKLVEKKSQDLNENNMLLVQKTRGL